VRVVMDAEEYKRDSPTRKSIRQQVYERDGGKCTRCGKNVYLNKEKKHVKNFAHMHHVIPRADGGPYSIGNLATTCWDCELDYHQGKRRQERKKKREERLNKHRLRILD